MNYLVHVYTSAPVHKGESSFDIMQSICDTKRELPVCLEGIQHRIDIHNTLKKIFTNCECDIVDLNFIQQKYKEEKCAFLATIHTSKEYLECIKKYNFNNSVLYQHHLTGKTAEVEVGHAVIVTQISDETLMIKNSWGEEWGDEGYCYLSMCAAKKLNMKFMVIRKKYAHTTFLNEPQEEKLMTAFELRRPEFNDNTHSYKIAISEPQNNMENSKEDLPKENLRETPVNDDPMDEDSSQQEVISYDDNSNIVKRRRSDEVRKSGSNVVTKGIQKFFSRLK